MLGMTVRTISAAPHHPCRRCCRRHREWYTVAACVWPKAIWIHGLRGTPPEVFALLSRCHPGGTITLWASLEAALDSKSVIDTSACGGRCIRAHEIFKLSAA